MKIIILQIVLVLSIGMSEKIFVIFGSRMMCK